MQIFDIIHPDLQCWLQVRKAPTSFTEVRFVHSDYDSYSYECECDQSRCPRQRTIPATLTPTCMMICKYSLLSDSHQCVMHTSANAKLRNVKMSTMKLVAKLEASDE